MASIQSYPTNTTPKASDLLLGTKVPLPNTEDSAVTNNVSIASVAAFANSYKQVQLIQWLQYFKILQVEHSHGHTLTPGELE